MGNAIGEILAFAVGVAISPIPIVGVVLMLATPQGRINGPAFIGGWLAGLIATGGVALLLAGGAGAGDADPGDWVYVLKLVLGLAAVGFGVRRWRRRPGRDESRELPRWMQTIDRFTAGRAATFGIILTAANPKNLLLAIAAGAAIAQAGASTGGEIGSLLVFALIGSVGVAAPVVIYFGMGERSAAILDDMRRRLTSSNGTIVAVLLVVIGAKLIGDAISGLSL